MMAVKDSVFGVAWLVSLLGLWLRLPHILRFIVATSLFMCAAGALMWAWLHAPNDGQSLPPPTSQVFSDVDTGLPERKLPALTSAGLFELTQSLEEPALSQQRDSFRISFSSTWAAFAEFTNQVAQSNLAPQDYRLDWDILEGSSSEQHLQLAAAIHLVPGSYRGDDRPVMPLPPISPAVEAPLQKMAQQCSSVTFPAISVQASWPSRGYIQVLINQRSTRIALNELLENSWQLLRIGSESVEFRAHSVASGCPQPESVTVAI